MPTYAYACKTCGNAFDVHQSFEDDPLTVCPECQGRVHRVLTSVGVTFKGSGFYRNDSRSSSSGSRNGSATKKEPADAAAAPAKKESSDGASSKPAPKSDAPAAPKAPAKAAATA